MCSISWKRCRNTWMTGIVPFWKIFCHGQKNFRQESAKLKYWWLQSSRLKMSRYSLFCVYIVLSNFLCMFCFLFLNLAFQGNMEELASILSLVISFVIMPFYVLKKQHNIKISEIGIAKIGITDSIFLISAVIFSVFLFITKGNLKIFTEVVSQQLFVSISEEILMRGIIFYLLSQLFRKKYYVVIVSAIIFGFALHTGGDFLSNLVYRFPAGIILAVLRIYTKKLYPPMVVHFMYNLWCIYL